LSHFYKFIIFLLLLIQSQCHFLWRDNASTLYRELKNSDQIYYSFSSIERDASVFQSIGLLHLIRLSREKNTLKVNEINLVFSTYTSAYLQKIKKHFSKGEFNKFSIVGKIKKGRIHSRENKNGLEIDLVEGKSIVAEGNNLEELAAAYNDLLEKPDFQPMQEKYLYKVSERYIWQSISSELTENGEMLLWKNYQGGLNFFKPYTEFSPGLDFSTQSSDYNYKTMSLEKLQIDKNTGVLSLAFKDKQLSAFFIVANPAADKFVTTDGKAASRLFKNLKSFMLIRNYGKKKRS